MDRAYLMLAASTARPRPGRVVLRGGAGTKRGR